ncbi:hypothetical protein Pcinc_030490 [Petrolisthes cinctipes]|uniref:Uncharacterized protein n=1 Tax=Petrolisthes cinctipes TaxID=88211 RepID=A0AAE1K5Z6_PETCI|nr:hypothetical protein Pcinc_030490 [Petrolisthes cinctipes]
MPHVTQPYKIIVETQPMGPWFKGEPTEHVHNFVREVEAIMATKGLTDDTEKINFIKARIRGNATSIISGSSFSTYYVGDNYNTFRELLLSAFGKGKQSGQLAWMSRAIDVAVSRTRSLDISTARDVAGQLFNDIKDTLSNATPLPNHPSWTTQGDQLSLHAVCELFEYYIFLQMLKPEDYTAAMQVERKRGEHFVSVSGRIEAKQVRPITPYAISLPSEGAAVQPQMVAASVSNPGVQPVPKHQANKGYYKATLDIKYYKECRKHGHTWEKCFFNEDREMKPKNPTSRPEGNNNRNYNQRNNRQTKPGGHGKWCEVHQITSHNTWECRTLIRKEKELIAQRQNKSSGEDWDRQKHNQA